jgi:hypothetical protein
MTQDEIIVMAKNADYICDYDRYDLDWLLIFTELIEEQTAAKEPVAVVDANDKGFWADILPDQTVKVGQLLYTTPQQSTWFGLEQEDRLCAKYMQDAPDGIDAVIDYIEDKLKWKNYGQK